MKIRVEKVSVPTFSKLVVTLVDPIFQAGEKLTDIGCRLERILTMHTKQFELVPGIERIDSRTAQFMLGENVAKRYTQATLQAELDTFANTPIKLQFAAEVGDERGVLTTPAHAIKSRENGGDIYLAIGIKSNLPLIVRDAFLLKELVPGGNVWLCRSPGHLSPSNIFLTTADMGCVVRMSHEQVTEMNPWVFAKQLQAKIQKIIV